MGVMRKHLYQPFGMKMKSKVKLVAVTSSPSPVFVMPRRDRLAARAVPGVRGPDPLLPAGLGVVGSVFAVSAVPVGWQYPLPGDCCGDPARVRHSGIHIPLSCRRESSSSFFPPSAPWLAGLEALQKGGEASGWYFTDVLTEPYPSGRFQAGH